MCTIGTGSAPPRPPGKARKGHELDTDRPRGSRALRELTERLVFILGHERQEIIVHKVGITHGGRQVRVTRRLLHERGALPFREPRRHPTVAEVALSEVGGKLGPLGRRVECTV